MGNEREDKIGLRRYCASVRDNIDPREKAAADASICRRILSLSSYRFADTVLLYYPIRSEVDLIPVMEDALAKEKTLALPRCESEPGLMTFRAVRGLSALTPGAYRVPEPPADAPIVAPVGPDGGEKRLFLAVPALAFDREGYRLGYGKGYYDRFLGTFRGSAVGVVYERLILERLPRGFFDRKIPLIISEGGVKLTHA